jgi:hypothetical protein
MRQACGVWLHPFLYSSLNYLCDQRAREPSIEPESLKIDQQTLSDFIGSSIAFDHEFEATTFSTPNLVVAYRFFRLSWRQPYPLIFLSRPPFENTNP